MRVAGIMSGTSLDGIDVAIVDIGKVDKVGRKIRPMAFHSTPYPEAVRKAILGVSNTTTTTAEIARLHFLLGQLYARAVRANLPAPPHSATLDRTGRLSRADHLPPGRTGPFLGRPVAATLQIGEAGVIAEALGVPVVSDFRTRDMAAGGKGAPLVPYVDYLLFRHAKRGRVALNIGGIANITAIPPGAPSGEVMAFDTGPGNMVIDALVDRVHAGPAALRP